MKRSLILPAICLAVQAAIIPSLSLEELVDQSEIILHGRIGRAWSAWDASHKYIWTHHQLTVIDSIRGASRSVVVSEPGGSLDGMNMAISGGLEYGAGEEVVVFLYRTPIGYMRATGYGQGKYTVTPQRRVHANLKGLELMERRAKGGVALSTLEGLSVEDFKARVRAALPSRR